MNTLWIFSTLVILCLHVFLQQNEASKKKISTQNKFSGVN